MRGMLQGCLSLSCATPENKRFGTAEAEKTFLSGVFLSFSLSGALHDGVLRGDR